MNLFFYFKDEFYILKKNLDKFISLHNLAIIVLQESY